MIGKDYKYYIFKYLLQIRGTTSELFCKKYVINDKKAWFIIKIKVVRNWH